MRQKGLVVLGEVQVKGTEFPEEKQLSLVGDSGKAFEKKVANLLDLKSTSK